jgi:hypothetical protein
VPISGVAGVQGAVVAVSVNFTITNGAGAQQINGALQDGSATDATDIFGFFSGYCAANGNLYFSVQYTGPVVDGLYCYQGAGAAVASLQVRVAVIDTIF